MQQVAIESEAGRRRKLTNEEPSRYPRGASRTPLREDLAADCRQQHGRAQPTDDIHAFHGHTL